MTRRVHALLIAFLAIPGLLGRQVIPVVHEHDGGSDPHHHAPLVAYISHSHSHTHPHGDHVRADEAQGPAHPASEDGSPDEGGSPGDGDRHGHFGEAQAAAARRAALPGEGVKRPAGAAPVRVLPAHERLELAACGRPPSPGDRRGHPTSRTGRAIDRLVQGIGLLI